MLSRRYTRITFALLAAGLIAMGVTLCGQAVDAASSAQPVRWALAIHGGAGDIRPGQLTPAAEAAYRADLEEALRIGARVLDGGGSSLDAVEAAISLLEDSPLFNAGRGAVTTAAGAHELDASIMEGRTRAAGAVAGVQRIRNPLRLARLVMERTPHVLLTGQGAEAFATEQGVELAPAGYFEVPRASADSPIQPSAFGTVGAVARDVHGNLAAGTSTGGMQGKRTGRVGDSPIVGAGTYAYNACGAISATGHGEFFIRAVVAYDICATAMYSGLPLRQAAEQVIMDKLVAFGGTGGVIAIDADGQTSFSFNSMAMYRGSLNSSGELVVGIFPQ
jgi:L-asparaginase / beta-aspartyl-peptidase